MVQPYRDSTEHLLAELKRVDLMLRRAVVIARQARRADTPEEFRGLVISEDHVDRMLDSVDFLGDIWRLDSSLQRSVRVLDAELDSLQEHIRSRMNASARAGDKLALRQLAATFDLSPAEVDILLIGIAPELEPRYEVLYGYLQNDVTRKRPSVDLCLNLICRTSDEKIQARQAFSPASPLFNFDLMRLHDEAYDRSPTRLRQFVKSSDAVLSFLLERQPQRTADARWVVPATAIDELETSPGSRRELAGLAEALRVAGTAAAIVQLWGGDDAAVLEAAKALAQALQKNALIVDWGALGAASGARSAVVRDAALWDDLLILERGATQASQTEHGRADRAEELLLARIVDAGLTAVMLSSNDRFGPVAGCNNLWRVQVDGPDFAAREAAWRRALGSALSDEEVSRLADFFAFSGSRLAQTVSLARGRATLRDASSPTMTLPDVLAAGRDLTTPNIHRFAIPIEPRYTWDDLVLPPDEAKQLRAVAARLQYRNIVQRHWQFGAKSTRGRGLAVLFTGTTGAGKTMAAEVLAHELSLRMFQIDLSSVVSKYIGETESHLSQIFREAELSQSLLFFDEADALFGKRTEVSDAHDRYANIEVNYLLQRIEQYEGIVVLATNFQDNIDEAFLRRVQCVVRFPFPDERAREQIWKRQFPAQAPVADGMDFSFLANQFKLSGGNIRNAALEAAFIAAEEGGGGARISMQHVIQAVKHEYQKQGKLVMKADLGRYWRAS